MVIQAFKTPPRDRHWQDAGRLMAERGIAAPEHQCLQENLATYLSHRAGDDQLAPRWQNKLDRELAHPYGDSQVGERIDQLQNSLKSVLDSLPAYPSQLYLTGSFSRGRLGVNSDLDAYGTIRPEHLHQAFDVFEATVAGSDACLVPFSEETPGRNLGNLLATGASVKVEASRLAESGYLRQVYKHVQSERSQRKETSALYEWMTGKVWSEELDAQQKREEMENGGLAHHAMALAGTLAAVPLVGPLVHKTADLFVHQSHLES
jgi:hypothetical protein